MTPAPRIELEDLPAPRLEPVALPALIPDASTPRWGTAALMLSGAVVLAVGMTTLSIASFAADQFARAAWLGWTTVGVATAGAALLGTGLWRELRALAALSHVDSLRAALSSGDPTRIMHAAIDWPLPPPVPRRSPQRFAP